MEEQGNFSMQITAGCDMSAVYAEWDKLLQHMDETTRNKFLQSSPLAQTMNEKLGASTLVNSGAASALNDGTLRDLMTTMKRLGEEKYHTDGGRASFVAGADAMYSQPGYTKRGLAGESINAEWSDAYSVAQKMPQVFIDRAQKLMDSPLSTIEEFKALADEISAFRAELPKMAEAARKLGKVDDASSLQREIRDTNPGSQFDLGEVKQDILNRAAITKQMDTEYYDMRKNALIDDKAFERQQMIDAFAENKKYDAMAAEAQGNMQVQAAREMRTHEEELHQAEIDHVAAIKINDQMDADTTKLMASAAQEKLRISVFGNSSADMSQRGATPYIQGAIAAGGSQADILSAANAYVASIPDNVKESNAELLKTQQRAGGILDSMKGIYGAMVISRGVLYSMMGGESTWMQLARQGSQAIYSSVYAYSMLNQQSGKFTEALVRNTREYKNNQTALGTVAKAQNDLNVAKSAQGAIDTAVQSKVAVIASDQGQLDMAILEKNDALIAAKQIVLDKDKEDLATLELQKNATDRLVASKAANLADESLAQHATGKAVDEVAAGISATVTPIISIVSAVAGIGMLFVQAVQWLKQLNIDAENSAIKFRTVYNEVRGLNAELSKAPAGTITDVTGMITYATQAKEINKEYLKMTAGLSDAEKAGIAFWMSMDKGASSTQQQLATLQEQLQKAQDAMNSSNLLSSGGTGVYGVNAYVPDSINEDKTRNFQQLTVLVENYKNAVASGKDPLLDYENAILGVRAATSAAIKTSEDWVAANKQFFLSNVIAQASESDRAGVTKDAAKAMQLLTQTEGGSEATQALLASTAGTQRLIDKCNALGGAALDAIPALREQLNLLKDIGKLYNEPQTPAEVAAYNASTASNLYSTNKSLVDAGGGDKTLTEAQRKIAIAAQSKSNAELQKLIDAGQANLNSDANEKNPGVSGIRATLDKNIQDLAAGKLALYNLQHPAATSSSTASSSLITALEYDKTMFDNYKTAYEGSGTTDSTRSSVLKQQMDSWRKTYTAVLKEDITKQKQLIAKDAVGSQDYYKHNEQLSSDTAQLQEILNLTNKIKDASATWFNIPGSIIRPTASVLNQVYVDGKFVTQTARTSSADLQHIVAEAIAKFERDHLTGAGNINSDVPETT